MKKLRISSTITAILGFSSFLAVFFMFLALSDIANAEPDTTLEWKIVSAGMTVIMLFLISTFITLSYLLKNVDLK